MSLLSTFYPEPVDAAALGLGTSDNVAFGSIQNTPIGSSTASTVAATNLSASGTVSGTGFSNYLASPPAIGNTTPAAGSFTTLTANNGTITASAPVLDLSQTWNASGTTFTGLRVNVTNTASATASLLADFQIGGTSQASIRRDGQISCSSVNVSGQSISVGANSILIGANVIGWGGSPLRIVNTDLEINRDAADAMAQRRGTNAQTFNIYNTFTSSTNHERGFLRWSSNVFQIGTEKGSGGGTARALHFQIDGLTRASISTGGNFIIGNGDGTTQSSSLLVWQGNARIGAQNTLTGVITLGNRDGDGFNRLQFGGTTSSFPALKRSSTVLQSRLADDSDFAPLQGQLRTHANAVTETITADKTLTLYDAAGTAYKVPCVAA